MAGQASTSRSGSKSIRMVSGVVAIIRPRAASHWYGNVRERTSASSPGSIVAVPVRQTPRIFTRTPGLAMMLRT
jgi:hypothetical protein